MMRDAVEAFLQRDGMFQDRLRRGQGTRAQAFEHDPAHLVRREERDQFVDEPLKNAIAVFPTDP